MGLRSEKSHRGKEELSRPRRALARQRPSWHRAVGTSQVAVGVALIVINYVDYSRSSLLPGGHQELYFVFGVLVAGSSIWWFGWFDRQPSPEDIRAAFDQERSSARRRPASQQEASSSGTQVSPPATPKSERRTKGR